MEFVRNFGGNTLHACNTEREERRKGSGVWAVLADDRREGKTCVQEEAYTDPGGHDSKDGAMDVEQEYREAGKEKEEGDMK